jgi:hypothetical protein
VQLNAAMKTVAETKVNMAKMRADAAARKTAMYNAHNQLLEQKAEIKVGTLHN